MQPEMTPNRPITVAMIGSRGIVDLAPSEGATSLRRRMGGSDIWAERLAMHLGQRGLHVRLYCRHPIPPGRQIGAGVELRSAPAFHTKHLEAITHSTACMLDILREPVDLLHIHSVGSALLAGVARKVGIPVVVTVHGADWERSKWGLPARTALKAGAAATARWANAITVVSPSLGRYFSATHGRTSYFTPPAVQDPVRRPFDLLRRHGVREPGYLLYLSRATREKNPHVLMKAFSRLATSKQLVVAGAAGGAYLEYLRKLAANDPRIVFSSDGLWDHEKEAAFTHAGAYVLPSEVEGMSASLLEALSYGLPVVISNIEANVDVVGPRQAYVFPVGDERALAACLTQLINEPERAQQLGKGGIAIARRYHWSAISDSMLDAYGEALERRLLPHDPS